jgi:hypothetical protein
MENLSGVAREHGVSDEELGTIQAIVMLVSAGRVYAQFREVCGKIKSTNQSKACCR